MSKFTYSKIKAITYNLYDYHNHYDNYDNDTIKI